MAFKVKRKAPATEAVTPPSPTPPPTKQQTQKAPSVPSAAVMADSVVDAKFRLPVVTSLPEGYDAKYPPLECTTCNIGVACPQYAEGYICAFGDTFRALNTRDATEVDNIQHMVLRDMYERYHFARLQERTAAGNFISPEVTRLGQQLLDMADRLSSNRQQRQSATVTIQGPETPGILSRIFGGQPKELPQPPVVAEQKADSGPTTVQVTVEKSGGDPQGS